MAKLAAAMLFRRQRGFLADARLSLEQSGFPVVLEGLEHIPCSGAFVLTANHYVQPGLPIWWVVFAATAAVGHPVHWIATAELTFPGHPLGWILRPASRWALKEIERIYEFTSMPPMPPRAQDVELRARSIRRVLRFVRRHPDARVGLLPEGKDTPGGVLSLAPPGSGRFALLLSQAGLLTLPAGIAERDGSLVVRFGPAYRLRLDDPAGSSEERDARAAGEWMAHIAALLPPDLRGPYTGSLPVEPAYTSCKEGNR